MTNVELVAAYWRHYQLGLSADRAERTRAEAWSWARDDVQRSAVAASLGMVELLVALAAAAPDVAALAYLGAGPVEDLIRLHGQEVVEAIDQAARTNEAFRTALRGVWYGDDVDPAIVNRLRRFGPPL